MIKFYAEHFDDIIWEKIDEADEIKHLAKVYRENPNSLDFQEDADEFGKFNNLDNIEETNHERQ